MIASVARSATALLVVLTFAHAASAQPEAPGAPPAPAAPAPPAADGPSTPDGEQAPAADGSTEVAPATAPDEQPAASDAPPPPPGDAGTEAEAAAPSQPAPPATQPPGAPQNPPWSPYGYGQKTPAPAPAPQEPEPPAPRDVPHRLGAELGVRTTIIMDEGLEPYGNSSVNLLGQLAVAATVVPLRFEPFSLALVPEYDVGQRTQETRGQDFSLAIHRLAVGVQADLAIIRHLHAYARIAPAAMYLHGSISDAAVEQNLVADQWTWGLDLTAGLAVLLGTAGDKQDPTVGFWFLGEWGYAFAGEADMPYGPEEDDEDPRRFGEINLPPVAPTGIVNRLSLGLSF